MNADSLSKASSELAGFIALSVALVLVLNVVDATFTLLWVQMGWATEANPVMAAMLNHSPVVFMLSKLALVSGGMGVLWKLRRLPLAKFGVGIASIVYIGIFAHHMTAVPHFLETVRAGVLMS